MPPLGPAPEWFTPPMIDIWVDLVAASPHLRAPDAKALATLTLAIHLHERDAIRLLEHQTPPEKLQIRVEAGARTILHLSRELALTPLTRARLLEAKPAGDDEDEGTGWELLRSLRVVEGGKR